MGSKGYRRLVASDLFRHAGNSTWRSFVVHFLWTTGFKYVLWMRTAVFTRQHPILWPVHFLARAILHRYQWKYGIQIPYHTRIGPGLYIGHWGGIAVHPEVTIGRNCNWDHDVTIGAAYGGRNPGSPALGDNVYLGPGCRVIGGITIGNNVAVGANAVVTESLPDESVAVGVPARVKSTKGAAAYVVNTGDDPSGLPGDSSPPAGPTSRRPGPGRASSSIVSSAAIPGDREPIDLPGHGRYALGGT